MNRKWLYRDILINLWLLSFKIFKLKLRINQKYTFKIKIKFVHVYHVLPDTVSGLPVQFKDMKTIWPMEFWLLRAEGAAVNPIFLISITLFSPYKKPYWSSPHINLSEKQEIEKKKIEITKQNKTEIKIEKFFYFLKNDLYSIESNVLLKDFLDLKRPLFLQKRNIFNSTWLSKWIVSSFYSQVCFEPEIMKSNGNDVINATAIQFNWVININFS